MEFVGDGPARLKEFIECVGCEFVFAPDDGPDPLPKGQNACPNCGEDEFRFIG